MRHDFLLIVSFLLGAMSCGLTSLYAQQHIPVTLCNILETLDDDVRRAPAIQSFDWGPTAIWLYDDSGRLNQWNDLTLDLPDPILVDTMVIVDAHAWYYRALGTLQYAVQLGNYRSENGVDYIHLHPALSSMNELFGGGLTYVGSEGTVCSKWQFRSQREWRSLRNRPLYIVLISCILMGLWLWLSSRLMRPLGWWQGTGILLLSLTVTWLIAMWLMDDMVASNISAARTDLKSDLLPYHRAISSLCLLGLSVHLLRYGAILRSLQPPSTMSRYAILLVGYLIMLLGIDYLIYLVYHSAASSLQVGQSHLLDRISVDALMLLVSSLMTAAALFFIGHLITAKLISVAPSNRRRLLVLSLSVVIHLPLVHFIVPALPLMGYLTLVTTTLVLMDLFVESIYRSVSWLVIWLVFMAMTMTALLYAQYKHMETNGYEARARLIASELTVPYHSVRIIPDHVYSIRYHPGTSIDPPHLSESRDPRRPYVYPLQDGAYLSLTSRSDPMVQFIILFTYLFTSLTVLLGVLLVLNKVYPFIPPSWHGSWPKRKSIRWRIQYAMFALMALSFALIYFLTSIYIRADQKERRAAQDEIAWQTLASWHARLSSLDIDDMHMLRFAPSVSVYEMDGRPMDSGHSILIRAPYALTGEDGALSYHLTGRSSETYLRRVLINGRTILLSHTVMKSANQHTILDKLLGSLLHIYLFLFVLTSSIALAFADSITRPLFRLSKRFGSIYLRRKNERIEWSGDDELGQLVNAYNAMITKIEESVDALAMTERESAWREMAKQVAHEIKNPLTPMKLSIQHLQMTAERAPDQMENLIARSAKTLLEQIDNLSLIASEFSNFAKMPQPDSQKIVLNSVVATVHDLFRKRDDIDIQLYVPMDEIYVFADRHYVSRVVINLVTNAIQAIPTDQSGLISIKLYKEGTDAVIAIIDNGTGIPVDIRDKIFQPNFTSKSTGTGLGLPICARIIELFNGKITYETVLAQGTTFYVALPLLRLEDNFPQVSHISL